MEQFTDCPADPLTPVSRREKHKTLTLLAILNVYLQIVIATLQWGMTAWEFHFTFSVVHKSTSS